MKIAITGPDGLLGSNVTRMLVDNGHEVVAFVQPYKAIPTLEPLPIEIRRGDVLDPDSVLDGVKGCNAI
ncbi:MAG: NAD(P)H-binding protein, partial [Sphaerochaetaceae bacterium]|nr:NAD(P)H-binding protein [Sphaerochaetaceae bacterium]